mgnify:CR=1 FL=1
MKKYSISLATKNKTAAEWIAWIRNYNAWTNPRPLSKEEFIALRDAVVNPEKGYERVAREFFFETLKPMVSGLAYQVLRTYKTVVNPLDLSTTIYCKFWDEGKFTRLKGYLGDCSLFSWVSLGAAQVVYNDLEELGIIKKTPKLTSKNTSLRLKSITNEDELNTILDFVTEPLWHDVLTEIYVKRTPTEKIMKKLNLDEANLKKTLKVAESALKEQLIATEFVIWHRSGSKKGEKNTAVNLVKLALGDVSGNLDTTSSDDALTIAMNKFRDMDIYDEIQEVLQLKYPNMNPEMMWDKFVKEQALLCGMTDNQLDVWIARYINHESPVSVAERLGMRRTNVDNLFSRANDVLKEHIRNWWKKNS